MSVEDARPPRSIDHLLRHRRELRAYLDRVTSDVYRADDAEQEAWLAALQSPPSELGAEAAWLRSVARNHVRRSHRSDARLRRREHAAARDERQPSAAEDAARREARVAVLRAVAALPEPFRTTAMLRYFEGMDGRAIAAYMDVPNETARSRLRGVRERLRAALRDSGHALGACAVGAVASRAATHSISPAVTTAAVGGTIMAGKKIIVAGAAALLLGGFVAGNLTGTAVHDEPEAEVVAEEGEVAAAESTPRQRGRSEERPTEPLATSSSQDSERRRVSEAPLSKRERIAARDTAAADSAMAAVREETTRREEARLQEMLDLAKQETVRADELAKLQALGHQCEFATNAPVPSYPQLQKLLSEEWELNDYQRREVSRLTADRELGIRNASSWEMRETDAGFEVEHVVDRDAIERADEEFRSLLRAAIGDERVDATRSPSLTGLVRPRVPESEGEEEEADAKKEACLICH